VSLNLSKASPPSDFALRRQILGKQDLFRKISKFPFFTKCSMSAQQRAFSLSNRSYIVFSKRALISTDLESPGGRICEAYNPQMPTSRSIHCMELALRLEGSQGGQHTQVKFGIPPQAIVPFRLHPSRSFRINMPPSPQSRFVLSGMAPNIWLTSGTDRTFIIAC